VPSHSWDVLARLSLAVPARVAALAEEHRGAGPARAVPALAASVILVRDSPAGLETYLLHRHARMPFAASMVVFPGGRVDSVDGTGGDPLRSCAVRETLEETGVRLREDDLVPWAHWITPEIEQRRYDTFFFVAALPAGEVASDVSGETDSADWEAPQAALTAAKRADISLMPPTMSILLELSDVDSVAGIMAVAMERVIEPVLPRLVSTDVGWAYAYPQRLAHEGSDDGSGVKSILAPNPGPMTLDGTNTWIAGDPRRGAPILVDPGPLDDDHLTAIMEACGGQISAILLTHRHVDHSEAAAELAHRAGCSVRAADPELQVGPDGLADGDVMEAAGVRLLARATPGHTSDSISLLCTGADGVNRILTGDMVLGRGTTVITYPDGDLAAYFDSLELLSEMVRSYGVAELLPGHGPRVTDPLGWLSYYRRHREERLDQVRAALAAGARTPAEVVARVYADVDRTLWPAAEQSVRAQLDYLALS
jgi:glyoxylase-like metal-dependent hydrolase (beta-lactamase superfamily II)/8-oxo-dGTP pyrophosphatase MutT (NUDIX family)